MDTKEFRIIFMGTPDFAVESLKALINNHFNVVGVVTNPDKPAGRGQKLQESAVKKYAKNKEIPILQPVNLKDEFFISELQNLKPSLQIVVAFKILPPEVFNLPDYGTFNLHASLLPDYRGAAPINHAIINGETKTGVTTFFLDEKVDTGKIIDRKEVDISSDDTAGSLHDKLMVAGSQLVVKTVNKIIENTYQIIDQQELIKDIDQVKKAPKIFKKDCKINWNKPVQKVHNFIRGLSPYPSAWTNLVNENKKQQVKIFLSRPLPLEHRETIGNIKSDGKSSLQVACRDGYIDIKELQLAGKKKMKTSELLRGLRDINKYRFE